MTFKPEFILIDVETVIGDRGSIEFYRPDFRVTSMALSWFESGQVTSKYIEGESAIETELRTLVDAGIPVAAHNWQFELGVIKCRFPHIYPRIKCHCDTMRLVQVYDNG